MSSIFNRLRLAVALYLLLMSNSTEMHFSNVKSLMKFRDGRKRKEKKEKRKRLPNRYSC